MSSQQLGKWVPLSCRDLQYWDGDGPFRLGNHEIEYCYMAGWVYDQWPGCCAFRDRSGGTATLKGLYGENIYTNKFIQVYGRLRANAHFNGMACVSLIVIKTSEPTIGHELAIYYEALLVRNYLLTTDWIDERHCETVDHSFADPESPKTFISLSRTNSVLAGVPEWYSLSVLDSEDVPV